MSKSVASLSGPDESAPPSFQIGGPSAQASEFRAAASLPSCAIATCAFDGTINGWSAGCKRLFGYADDEVMGKNLCGLFMDADQSFLPLREHAERSEPIEVEARARTKDGHLLDVLLEARSIQRDDGPALGLVVFVRDVSLATLTRSRLHAARQVESMADAAVGLVHDLNGILTVVGCYSRFVAEGALTPKQQEDLSVAVEAASRGAVLTDQLLGVYGKRRPRATVVDVVEAVRDICSLVRRMLAKDITLTTRLPTGPLKLMAGPGQLDRIVLNLVTNARDAMRSGGVLTISVRASVVDADHALHGQVREGRYAVIVVRDTGVGMDASTRSRIFQSSFTTKPDGEGTGLGLGVVQEMVRDLHGVVRVESEKNWGAAFSIYLPLLSSDVEGGPAESMVPAFEATTPSAGTRTGLLRPRVLVVDDDAGLRESLVALLAKDDVDAIAATSPRNALHIMRTRAIDVVVTEQVMNEMNGIQLLDAVREHFPETACILFTDQISSDFVVAAVNGGRLSKILLKKMALPVICDEVTSVAWRAARRS